MIEKRRHFRADSINLLNYVLIDADAGKSIHGMGRTLNISESGIMLEVHEPFRESDMVDVVMGIKEDIIPARGKVVFTKPTDTGKFRSGIEFLVIEPPALETLRRNL